MKRYSLSNLYYANTKKGFKISLAFRVFYFNLTLHVKIFMNSRPVCFVFCILSYLYKSFRGPTGKHHRMTQLPDTD